MTDTLVNDSVSETTLGYGAGWSAKNVDCVVHSDVNIGIGGAGVSGVSMACGSGMAQLVSV